MAATDLEETMANLMRAALAGDESAYADFLRHGTVAARRVITYRLGRASPVAPEDVVQETLLAVHLKRHTWRQSEPILPWFLSIARHKLVDACRRQRVRISVPIDGLAEFLAAPDATDRGADNQHIERAVEGLSEAQRKVVRSIAIEGRTIRETAAALAMKEGTVRVAFHRGLSALSQRFGRQT